jgi:hypothetical protein
VHCSHRSTHPSSSPAQEARSREHCERQIGAVSPTAPSPLKAPVENPRRLVEGRIDDCKPADDKGIARTAGAAGAVGARGATGGRATWAEAGKAKSRIAIAMSARMGPRRGSAG